MSEVSRLRHFWLSLVPKGFDIFIAEYCREIDTKPGNNRCILNCSLLAFDPSRKKVRVAFYEGNNTLVALVTE